MRRDQGLQKPSLRDVAAQTALLQETLPVFGLYAMQILELQPGRARLALPSSPQSLRPGGTISGPAQFALADVAFYAALLTLVPDPVGCVTASLDLRFLRRPPPETLIAEATILARHDGLATGQVRIRDLAGRDLALATGLYTAPGS